MDLARQRFNLTALPRARAYFYDSVTSLEHHAYGGSITSIVGHHWRSLEVYPVEDSSGHWMQQERAQLTFASDVVSVDMRDHFVRDGKIWEVDTEDGRGIESLSPGTTQIDLVHVESMRTSTPNSRMT